MQNEREVKKARAIIFLILGVLYFITVVGVIVFSIKTNTEIYPSLWILGISAVTAIVIFRVAKKMMKENKKIDE